jgi:hypothetical protein
LEKGYNKMTPDEIYNELFGHYPQQEKPSDDLNGMGYGGCSQEMRGRTMWGGYAKEETRGRI